MGEMTSHSVGSYQGLSAETTYENSGRPSHLLQMASGNTSTSWRTKARMFYLNTGRYRSVSQPLLLSGRWSVVAPRSRSLNSLCNLTTYYSTSNPNGEPQPMRLSLEITVVAYSRYPGVNWPYGNGLAITSGACSKKYFGIVTSFPFRALFNQWSTRTFNLLLAIHYIPMFLLSVVIYACISAALLSIVEAGPSVQLDAGTFNGIACGNANQFLGIPFSRSPCVHPSWLSV